MEFYFNFIATADKKMIKGDKSQALYNIVIKV